MRKPIYRRRDEWVLGSCQNCQALNYVEPHGCTATCSKCKQDTPHSNINYAYRDASGFYMIKPLPSKKKLAK